ncbi:MAG TPA: TOBE domain-containing protein [Candidatus Sulfotelmatobacter sp.]|jgi:molybdate transport system regulatory protein|nr:TOBE domain-containing protein [Candidatus Sulfotelmatobacter sp.]
MKDSQVEALLALRGKGQGPIGRDRIAMLEAVAEHGSITQAAKVLGFSYKAVWDGVNAINNLLPRPALLAQAGGRGGGGAALTEEGRRLISAFRRLEEKLTRISRAIVEDEEAGGAENLFWSLAMKTSARNAFRCEVVDVRRAPVNVEVSLRVSEQNTMVAVVTNDSAEELGLVPGREVVALVKSSFVMLARGDVLPRVSARNLIWGQVVERIDGGVNSEIILDIGDGKTLTAVITRESAEELPLTVGDRACALFKASHVILAVD